MGSGIAEVAARAGLEVRLYDVTRERGQAGREALSRSLERAVTKARLERSQADQILARVTVVDELQASGCAVVFEAVSENISLKKQLFGQLSEQAPEALLATNTSSLSVTEIAAAAAAPDRVVGMHFFNPAPVMALLEIVTAVQTSEASLDQARQLAERFGKTPIVVRDVAGFATSRLGIILGMEAIRMVEMGVASAADIDKAMELGYRHPMGPLKLTDLVGLDVRLAIAEHLTRELGPQFSPPPLLRTMVRAGHLGKKSGQGFYRWDGNQAHPLS